MSNAVGLYFADVGAEHVEPVTKLVGKRLMAAANEAAFVSSEQIKTDFNSPAPAAAFFEIARVRQVAPPAAVAKNDASFGLERKLAPQAPGF